MSDEVWAVRPTREGVALVASIYGFDSEEEFMQWCDEHPDEYKRRTEELNAALLQRAEA